MVRPWVATPGPPGEFPAQRPRRSPPRLVRVRRRTKLREAGMAGTDDAVAAGDDALYVLTAVLLTPAKFPSVLGDDYPEACAALGLAPSPTGTGSYSGRTGRGRAGPSSSTTCPSSPSPSHPGTAAWSTSCRPTTARWSRLCRGGRSLCPCPRRTSPRRTTRSTTPRSWTVRPHAAEHGDVGPRPTSARRRRDRPPVGVLAGPDRRQCVLGGRPGRRGRHGWHRGLRGRGWCGGPGGCRRHGL